MQCAYCIYITHTYMHTYIHIYITYIHLHTYIHTYIDMHTYIHTFIHTVVYIHKYIIYLRLKCSAFYRSRRGFSMVNDQLAVSSCSSYKHFNPSSYRCFPEFPATNSSITSSIQVTCRFSRFSFCNINSFR